MMPKIKFLLLIIATSCMLNSTTSFGVELKRSNLYTEKVKSYALFHGTYDIVMFGDSLTERGFWQDALPNKKIGNRGISGDDTYGMDIRKEDVLKTGARMVFIMGGTNDITHKYPPIDIVKNTISIATYFRNQGIKPIIQSIILSGKDKKYKNPEIKKINRMIYEKSKSLNIEYLDLNKELAPDGYLPDDETIDGTHLTLKGYKLWYSYIKKSTD